MDDPFADIPIVGKGQAGSVPTALSEDVPIGPNGEVLNLPPNTGATNTYGGIPAIQTAEPKASVAEDPFADIPMMGKAPESAAPSPKIELEKDNPFFDVSPIQEQPSYDWKGAAIAAGSTAVEQGAGLIPGTFAARAISSAVPIPIVGPALGMAGMIGVQQATEYGLKKLEGALGVREQIEQAQEEHPTVSSVAGYSVMAPWALTSLKNIGTDFAKTLSTEGATQAAKQLAGKITSGAIGGAVIGPIRYGLEAAEYATGIRKEQPTPITSREEIENGIVGIILSGHAEAQKKNEALGGPEPEVAPSANPVVNEKQSQIDTMARQQFVSPEQEVSVEKPPLRPAFEGAPPVEGLEDLYFQQAEHDEGTPDYIKYQVKIDALKKGEPPLKQESSVAEQAPQAVSAAGETPAVKPTAEAPEGLITLQQAVDQNLISPQRLKEINNPASWIIRNRETGETVLETSDKKVADKINKNKYEAIPALLHLEQINGSKDIVEKDGKYYYKPAEAPIAEAQTEKPNAVQITSPEEALLRTQGERPSTGMELPRVGEEVPKEAPPQGETPKEEVTVPNTLGDAKTPEEVDSFVKAERQRLSQMFPTNTSNESVNIRNKFDLGKRSKALGMEAAAIKRRITGNLTAKEAAAKAKREESNYKGKPVSVDGKNGTVIGNPFGRVKVRFEDGTESTHLPEKIKTPIEAKTQTPVVEPPKEKSQLELWADNTIKEGKKRLNVGLDPEVLSAYAIKGAFKISRGVKDFTAWSKEMLSEFGETIRPHLEKLWKEAQEKVASGEIKITGEGRPERFSPEEAQRRTTVKRLFDIVSKNEGKPGFEKFSDLLARKYPDLKNDPAALRELYSMASGERKGFAMPSKEAPPAAAAMAQGETISKNAKIVGPSARLMKEAEARGEIIAPSPQEGVSPKESLFRGQNLINKGADPEQVLRNFEKTKRFSTDDQDVVRAKSFELAQNADKASKKGISSPEYIAARDAHQKWVDRSQSMTSEAGSALENLKGGNDIDTGTFYGMQDSFYKRTHKNFTLTQAESAKKLSDKVKSYSEEEQKKQSDLNNALDDALKDVPSEPIASPDNARQQVADAEPSSQAEINKNSAVLESENNRIEQQLAEHKKTIAELQEELKSRPSKIKIISDKASKTIDDLAAEAEKRIAQRRKERAGRLFTGVDTEVLKDIADAAIIGAKFIKDGALGLTEWTNKMLDKYGDSIRPYLDQIRKQSDDIISKFEQKKVAKRTAKQATSDSLESEINSARNSINKIGKPSTEIEAETISKLEKQINKAQTKLDEINSGKIEDPKKLLGPISERVNDLQKQKSDIEKQIREIKNRQSEQERTDISNQTLRNRARNLDPVGENITPKQAKIIWDYSKKFYLDKGTIDYTEMVNKVADDLGLQTDSIQRAFASPKLVRNKINKLIDAQYNRDVAVRAAKRWLDEQEKSWGRKYLDKAFSLQTKLKITGHGSAAAGTHAPSLLFTNPKQWFKTWGDSFKYSFTGEKGRRQNYVDNQDIKSDKNYHTARKYGAEVDPDKKQQGYEHSDSENRIIKALNKVTGGRGYDALFSLRMRMWNSVWEPLSAEEKTPEFGKFLADWVNHQTGFAHGEYVLANNLAKYAFFAKPLYKSRWGWLLGDPLTAGKNVAKWVAGKATPAEKLQATIELRTKLKFVAAYATMLGFNQAVLALTGSNQKINWNDWKKGDWLAFKGFGYEGTPMYSMTRLIRLLGNEIHILNPFSKLSPYERAQGERKNVFINNIRDYLAGGWSPGVQNIFSIVSGKDYAGNIMPWSSQKPKTGAHKLTPFQAAAGFLLPIPIAEAVSQKRWTEGAVKGIASGLFGIQLRTPEDVERFSHIKSQQKR